MAHSFEMNTTFPNSGGRFVLRSCLRKSEYKVNLYALIYRGGSRTATTSKMERFVITVNGWKPLTIITKYSILDVAAVLDLRLIY